MLTGPLFNAGRTLGNYRASIAQSEQARLQYEQAVLVALREVSDALTALGKLSEAETGQDTAVRALEEAVGHATDRYRQGLASYYEVLEAQQQLYPAQTTLAQIRRSRLHDLRPALQGARWRLEPERCAVDRCERSRREGQDAVNLEGNDRRSMGRSSRLAERR